MKTFLIIIFVIFLVIIVGIITFSLCLMAKRTREIEEEIDKTIENS